LAECEQLGKRRIKDEKPKNKREKKRKKRLDTNRPSHGRSCPQSDPEIKNIACPP
jgi:hypothetical protein